MNIKLLRSFLSSISLTNNQVNEIVREYPNIIEICEENRINEIDVSKLHGIGPYILKVIERKKISNRVVEAIKLNNKWNLNTDKYFKIKDFTLTPEQSQTLNMVCENNISILTGSAGTGKSSSILALINMIRSNNKSFILAAPTGMAAKVASRYTNASASTIHKLLGFDVITKLFNYQKNKKLPYDMVIIDEVSMCDIFLFCSLLEAIDFKKTKLLLIGDSAQLPSVGAGNILYDLVNSKVVPVNSLTKVFRTGEGGILTAATYARTSKSYLSSSSENQYIGNDKSYVFIPSSPENMMAKIKKLYSSLLQKGYTPKDILILSSYNKGNLGTNKINEEIQLIANSNCTPKNKNILVNNFDGSKTQFYVNDLVLQTKNNYHATNKQNNINIDNKFTFIPNGEIGIIKNISEQGIETQFENTVLYQKEDMKNLKLAYAISVHKSQGGCAKIVILITPSCHAFMLSSNLLYVGITRATEKVYHLGDTRTINRVVHKKVDFKRETSLLNMLKGCD